MFTKSLSPRILFVVFPLCAVLYVCTYVDEKRLGMGQKIIAGEKHMKRLPSPLLLFHCAALIPSACQRCAQISLRETDRHRQVISDQTYCSDSGDVTGKS